MLHITFKALNIYCRWERTAFRHLWLRVCEESWWHHSSVNQEVLLGNIFERCSFSRRFCHGVLHGTIRRKWRTLQGVWCKVDRNWTTEMFCVFNTVYTIIKNVCVCVSDTAHWIMRFCNWINDLLHELSLEPAVWRLMPSWMLSTRPLPSRLLHLSRIHTLGSTHSVLEFQFYTFASPLLVFQTWNTVQKLSS